MIKNVYWSSRKILMKLEFSDRFLKSTLISNLMKMPSLGGKFFHADGETDGHDETSRLFSKFCEAPKKVRKC